MPNGQKENNLYKSLAIFSCSALIFIVMGIVVYAQVLETNTYNKETGNELKAGNWNQLAVDFLFKEPIGGKNLQRINDNIGINIDASSVYNLRAQGPMRASHILTINHSPIPDLDPGEIVASLFTGDLSATNVTPGLFGSTSSSEDGHYLFPTNLTVNGNFIGGGSILSTTGDVGGNQLCIYETDDWVCRSSWEAVLAEVPDPEDGFWSYSDSKIYPNENTWHVGIGTNSPERLLDVDGLARFVEIEMNTKGETETPKINMNAGNIENVGKITVGTIDPLYRIDGINYSTFASAIVGGVKEELISRVLIDRKNGAGEYEQVIDFSKVERGSELWVWYYTVDFNKDNIEVLITPYGSFAQTYYLIEGDKLIFRSDRPIEASYRLMGKRFDWRNWPLKADDQEEVPSFTIETK